MCIRDRPKEKGIYRWIWDLSEEAVDRPKREDDDSDDDDEDEERSGKPVLPGTYSVVLTNGTIHSKAKIDVALDPRVEDSEAAFKVRYEALTQLEKMTALAAEAVQQVQNSQKEVKAFIQRLKAQEVDDSLNNTSSEILKKLEALEALFLGKKDNRQGIVRNPTPHAMTRIYRAAYYVRTRPKGITDTERQLIAKAKNQFKNALEMVNAFYANDWDSFSTVMEKLPHQEKTELKTFDW